MGEELQLYEALLWEPGQGYFLLDLHMRRLEGSADQLGFTLDPLGIRQRLSAFAAALGSRPRKVRLLLSSNGNLALEEVDVAPSTPVRITLADEPVASGDPLLRHKTSRRDVYKRALAGHPEAEDVQLWNERRELTETCTGNLVLDIDGCRQTPALSSGLLPGTFRAYLLERGEIEEAILPVEALERATGCFRINSVRRWCELRLLDS